MTLRILIADDHKLIRRGIRDLLTVESDWHVIGEAADGIEAIRLACQYKPDIAILDCSMPRLDGLSVSLELNRLSAATRVIFFTMHDSDAILLRLLSSGASALVLKSDAEQDLVEAVKAVSRGRSFFSQDISRRFSTTGRIQDAQTPMSRIASPLTRREEEIIALLATGMTSREVANELKISVRTAECHRININRKLNFKSIADLVHYAMHHDIVASLKLRLNLTTGTG